jgi:hypothetical protein
MTVTTAEIIEAFRDAKKQYESMGKDLYDYCFPMLIPFNSEDSIDSYVSVKDHRMISLTQFPELTSFYDLVNEVIQKDLITTSGFVAVLPAMARHVDAINPERVFMFIRVLSTDKISMSAWFMDEDKIVEDMLQDASGYQDSPMYLAIKMLAVYVSVKSAKHLDVPAKNLALDTIKSLAENQLISMASHIH